MTLLQRQGYTLDTVLPAGAICYLRATANLSTGGIAVDRTDDHHPKYLAGAAGFQIIGLDIIGLDIVTPDITKPLREVEGVIVEVNAAPGFRMHVCPRVGLARNVAAPVWICCFPIADGRFPSCDHRYQRQDNHNALIAHIYRQTRRVVGYTTTDGIYIDDHVVKR
jgi:cyanophycin synthetase